MDTRFFLFLHADEGNLQIMLMNTAVLGQGLKPWTRLFAEKPAAFGLYAPVPDPLSVITALHRVDWEHAPLLVYHTDGDRDWSHLRITRRVATLSGDEAGGGEGT